MVELSYFLSETTKSHSLQNKIKIKKELNKIMKRLFDPWIVLCLLCSFIPLFFFLLHSCFIFNPFFIFDFFFFTPRLGSFFSRSAVFLCLFLLLISFFLFLVLSSYWIWMPFFLLFIFNWRICFSVLGYSCGPCG